MELDIEINRIIRCLEMLNQIVLARKSITTTHCQTLRELLKPWKIDCVEPSALVVETKELSRKEVSLPQPVEQDPMPDLVHIDKLLTKVRKVRSKVNDEEVKTLCHITTTNKVPGPSKPRQQQSSASAAGEPTASKASRPLSNSRDSDRRVRQSKNSTYQTTYQTSFKARSQAMPKTACPVNKRAEPVTSAALKRQEVNSGSALLVNRQPASVSQRTSEVAANALTENKHEEATRLLGNSDLDKKVTSEYFNLLKQGSELKVPKTMGQLISRHRRLQEQLASQQDEPAASITRELRHLPNRLQLYYDNSTQCKK